VRRIRLRTKFLLSLLVISAGLTTATLLIVRYNVQKQVSEGIREELRNSLNAYQGFESQREAALARSAELLAGLPIVRALMTTGDPTTIQDGSADIWRLSGSDLLLLADRTGRVVALQTGRIELERRRAQEFLRRSLDSEEPGDWWFGAGHLYEVSLRPIYFGQPSDNTALGYLAVGHEIEERAAMEFSKIASSEVAFQCSGIIVASTLSPSQKSELGRQSHGSWNDPGKEPHEIQLGSERYLIAAVNLPSEGGPPVSLSVLKSLDKATAFLNALNHILLGLGLISVLAGSALVFLISHTFTRPLENLVAGVRALEKGDFAYPLESSGGDEVAEVTAAFLRTRAALQETLNEEKRLEEQLRQAHKMEAVGRLAGGIAHDFNNLLTVIRGNSDLLVDREGSDDFHRRCIEQIQKAGARAITMTRQLLAFSRMQVLQPRVLDLNAVVADLGKMLPRLIGEHIEYQFQPGAELAPVKADPGQIEQVILNLAVNARDAMPSGGKLSVQTSNVVMTEADVNRRAPMTPGPYVLLSVNDTGHGMDEQVKAHIFEPFFTTKEIGKGTGLGLATVYGIVKQSGGFIWVQSSPGNGATFEIYLPQAVNEAAEAESEAKSSSFPRGNETVLVVEDEDAVRELTCEFLKRSGYTVLEARDGIDALEVAGRYSGTIHLMLSDMVMPRMGGAELAEKLKAIRPKIKFAFMSGYSEYSSYGANQVSPGVSVLQKPFTMASLIERVRESLAENGVEKKSAASECPVR
jgi:signal transduction histidine kinase/CheY-like chemotaxis protein